MIKVLEHPNFTTFDKRTLVDFEPYFGIDYNVASDQERYQWFKNLLELAKYNLGIAHCVHHNHYAKSVIQAGVHDGKISLGNIGYTESIGCLSNVKSLDTLKLEKNVLSGTKHWISILDIADYAVFHVPTAENKAVEALVVINLADVQHKIDFDLMTPMGMEIAKPGSLTLENVSIPNSHILGYREYFSPKQVYFHLNNFADHCFITNYLGLIIGLYNEFKAYLETYGIQHDLEFKKIGLDISGLYMIWEDNLSTINTPEPSDQFWHRRNTQYTMSKNILLKLIALILQIGDSQWTSMNPRTQRFRDALTFCQHMKPLDRNLKEKHFVKF